MCIPQASQEGSKTSKKTTDCSSNEDAPIASLQRPAKKRVRKSHNMAAALEGATSGAQAEVSVESPSGGDPPAANHAQQASAQQI
jgi:hypothetical protein